MPSLYVLVPFRILYYSRPSTSQLSQPSQPDSQEPLSAPVSLNLCELHESDHWSNGKLGYVTGKQLERLYDMTAGVLPSSWGRNGSFASLTDLALAGPNNLAGSLPSEWGANGSWPKLENLFLNDTRLQGGYTACAPLH